MRALSALRYAATGAALSAVALLASGAATPAAEGQANFIHDGRAGFIVSDIKYAFSDAANEAGACANGLTRGYPNSGSGFLNRPDLIRPEGVTDPVYTREVFFPAISDPNIQNLCQNPELGAADPNWRTLDSTAVASYGIDLDGQASRAGGQAAPGTCAHDDFRGPNGERDIDNQFFRVVGCTSSFQSNGVSNTFATEMLTGTWGILIALSGVDDARNDPDVQVSLYASADPIQLGPTREPLENVSYAAVGDPRFRATTHGRLVNGVLITEPVDVRFYSVFVNVRTERPLRDARLRMTLTANGSLEGILAGYTPIEAMYDLQFGHRNGAELTGQPATIRARNISSLGQALAAGYTCQGAYYALHANADGHRDPASGGCTSISTQYRIRATPAFVIE